MQFHTKKRNKLETKRLNDLVFVKFNSKLKERRSLTGRDPFVSKDRTHVMDWIGASEEEEEIFQGSGLTWNLVAEASGAEEFVENRRSQRNVEALPTLGEEEEFMSDSESDDDIPTINFEDDLD